MLAVSLDHILLGVNYHKPASHFVSELKSLAENPVNHDFSRSLTFQALISGHMSEKKAWNISEWLLLFPLFGQLPPLECRHGQGHKAESFVVEAKDIGHAEILGVVPQGFVWFLYEVGVPLLFAPEVVKVLRGPIQGYGDILGRKHRRILGSLALYVLRVLYGFS